MQTTSHLLMIRPVNFTFNAETAVNNAFQQAGYESQAQEKAAEEFDRFVDLLRSHNIDVTVVNDSPQPFTPDSIFPNNWISFHQDAVICLYPMFAPNRRLERKPAVLEKLAEKFTIRKKIDFTSFEEKQLFLEGTGSMVLDRDNHIAYACVSPRTEPAVLEAFCSAMDYLPVCFHCFDSKGQAIYHTNVMMCVGDRYVVICLESISDVKERNRVKEQIIKSNKEILEISLEQVNRFAGNMLQVEDLEGKKLLLMSTQAYQSLSANQKQWLERFNPIIHSALDTIETNGGGSARCMMAEVFLPLKK